MKDVGTAAHRRQTLLVTGFGRFPGARRNPTLEILAGLERHRARLARLGVDLRCLVLPVVFGGIEPALRAAVAEAEPDVILHLGLAGRRHGISVETRAINRAGPLHPDAARRRPSQRLTLGAPDILRSTFPAVRIRAAIERAGVDADLSIDAGDYVCNATLYRSLAAGLAQQVARPPTIPRRDALLLQSSQHRVHSPDVTGARTRLNHYDR